jgi:hypothetical protein
MFEEQSACCSGCGDYDEWLSWIRPRLSTEEYLERLEEGQARTKRTTTIVTM